MMPQGDSRTVQTSGIQVDRDDLLEKKVGETLTLLERLDTGSLVETIAIASKFDRPWAHALQTLARFELRRRERDY